MFIITDMIQVRSITHEIIPFQSGSVFFIARQADQCAVFAKFYVKGCVAYYVSPGLGTKQEYMLGVLVFRGFALIFA